MRTEQRTRGRKLQAMREQHFRKEPLCVMCQVQGRITLAQELDHVVALSKGGSDRGKRQGLCKEHHLQKTAKDKGINYHPKVTIGKDGWPIGPTDRDEPMDDWPE